MAVKPAAAVHDIEAQKQKVREQNRIAAAEADRRKERQRKTAEERKKASEARRLKAENDKAAADKASKHEATSAPLQQEQGQGRDSSHTDLSEVAASTASAIGGIAVDVSSVATAQGKLLYEEAGKIIAKAKQAAAPKQRLALPKAEPRARVPIRRRNNAMKYFQKVTAKGNAVLQSVTRQYWPQMQDNTGVVALLLGAALLLVLTLFMYFML